MAPKKRKTGDAPRPPSKALAAQDGDDFAAFNDKQKQAKTHHPHAGGPNVSESMVHLQPQQRFDLKLPELEEMRNKAVEQAKANGNFVATLEDYGIYLLKKHSASDAQPIIAGYLNCPTVDELWKRFVDDEKVLDILKGLHQEDSKPNAYGMKPRQKPGTDQYRQIHFNREAFFSNLKQCHFQADDVTSDDVPSTDDKRFPTDSSIRMHLYWLRAAYRVIQAVPTSFQGPASSGVSRHYVEGLNIEAEDLNRFYVLFTRFYRRRVLTKTGNNSRCSDLARLPIWCLPSTIGANTEAQAAQNRQALENLFCRDWYPKPVLRKPTNERGKEHLRDLSAACDPLASSRVKLDPNLPRLEDTELEDVLHFLANEATYLYDDPDRADKFFQPPSQSAAVAEARECSKLEEVRAELSTHEQDSLDRRSFTDLQQQLNGCSAAPPDWDGAVKRLNLVVEDLGEEKDALTQENFRVHYRGLQLLPWQAQSSAFMLDMVDGPLKGCMNCDDVGTGKTVSVYVTVVQRSIEVQEKLDDYLAAYEALLQPHRPPKEEYVSDDIVIARTEGLEAQVAALGVRPKHRPVLIAMPSSALGAWLGDAAKFFHNPQKRRNITVRTLFALSGTKATSLERALSVGGSAKDLEDFVGTLDADDEATSRTCILSTFGCFARRCLNTRTHTIVTHGEVLGKASELKGSEARVEGETEGERREDVQREDEEDEDEDERQDEHEYESGDGAGEGQEEGEGKEEQEQEKYEADDNPDEDDLEALESVERSELVFQKVDLFSLVVIDEAHSVKNPASKRAAALYKLQNCAYILCSATPLIHSLRDLYGLVRFLWKALVHLLDDDSNKSDRKPNREAFVELSKTFTLTHRRRLLEVPENIRHIYLLALDPENFRSRISSSRSGPLDLSLARDIGGLIMMVAGLRRVMGEELLLAGRRILLGASIPPFRVTMVVLRQSDEEAALYRAAHYASLVDPQSHRPATVADAEQRRGAAFRRPPTILQRRLQQAALNPALDQMLFRDLEDSTSQGVQKLFNRGIDSFAIYHASTKLNLHHPLPTTRIDMAVYIAGASSKLQALCKELLEVVVMAGHKMVIYADWPLTIWLVKLLLAVLQIEFRSIHAGVSAAKRLEAEGEYNNNSAVKVLICSSRSASESLNLQKGGWHIVIMDLIPFMVLLQCIGRGFRFGQTHPQTIKVFTTDETHDQVLLWQHMSNYLTHLAATATVRVPEEVSQSIEREIVARFPLEDDDENARNYRQYAEGLLLDAYTEGLARRVFGMRCDITIDWADKADVYKKNLSASERLFRLVFGGDVAQEVLGQIEEHGKLSAAQVSTGEEDLRGEDAMEIDKDPDIKPASRGMLLANPYAAHLPRPTPDQTFSEEDHIAALVKAATDMAGALVFQWSNITAADCLRAAKGWVADPSPHVEVALDRLAHGMGAGLTPGPDGSGALDTLMEDAVSPGAEQTALPRSVKELSDEQKETYQKYRLIIKNFKSRPRMQKFAEREFQRTGQLRGSESEAARSIALAWIGKEIADGQTHHPKWNEHYGLDGKKAWAEVVARAEQDDSIQGS